MKNLLSALAIGLAAFTAADQADASRLNVITDAPFIDIVFPVADYAEFDGTGDLSIFGAEGVSFDLAPVGPLFFDILVEFDTTDPYATASGAFFSMDDDGAFLDGTLVQAGFADDILQLLFDDLTGSAAGDFTRFVLIELEFIAPFPGTDPLRNLADGTAYDVAATLSAVAAIPVPAALPLLAGALGGLVLLRRRG